MMGTATNKKRKHSGIPSDVQSKKPHIDNPLSYQMNHNQTRHHRSNTAIDVPQLDSGVKISTYPGKPSKSRLDLPPRDQPPIMSQRDLPPIRKLPNPVHRKSSVRDLQKVSPEEELSDSDQTENNQNLNNQTGRSSEYSVLTLSDVSDIASVAPNRTTKESEYQRTVSIFPPPKVKPQKESNSNCPPYAHNRPVVPRCSVSKQLISACVYTSSKFGQLEESRQNPEHTPRRRNVDAEVQGNKSRKLGGRTIIEATVPVTGSALDYIPTPIALPSKSSAISRKTQPRLNTGFEESMETEQKKQVSSEILEMLPQGVDMKELTEINTLEFGFAVLNDQVQHWLHIPPPLDVEITPSYEEDDVSDSSPNTKAEENMRKYVYALISQPFSAATACLRNPNPLLTSKPTVETSKQEVKSQQSSNPPEQQHSKESEESREVKIPSRKPTPQKKQNTQRAHSVPVSFKEPNSSTRARGEPVSRVQENSQGKLVSARNANFLGYEGFERNLEDLQVSWAKWTTSKIPRFCAESSVACLEKEAISQTLRVSPSLYCAVRDRFLVRRLAAAVAEHRDVVEQSLVTAATSEERQKEAQVVLRSMRGVWKLCLWEWDQRVKQNYEKRRSLDEMSNEIMKEKGLKKDEVPKLDLMKEKELIAKQELLKQQETVRDELREVRKSTMELVEKTKKMKSQLMSQTFRKRLQVLENHFDESEDAPAQALRILYALKSPNPSQKLSSSIRRFTNSSNQDEEFVQVPLGTPSVSVNSTPRPIRPAGDCRR